MTFLNVRQLERQGADIQTKVEELEQLWIIRKEESMSPHKQLVSDIERQSVRVRINLYKQMKEQLLSQMKLYQRQGKINF